MTGQRQPPAELTIGVVGPHDLVERVMLSGTATPGQGVAPADDAERRLGARAGGRERFVEPALKRRRLGGDRAHEAPHAFVGRGRSQRWLVVCPQRLEDDEAAAQGGVEVCEGGHGR